MSDFAPAAEVASARALLERLKVNMRATIKGKDEVIEQSLVCLLADGHLLIEDLPGVGKTTLAYTLARSMDCSFSRIQFTSDLLPSDVTGVSIYDETVKQFIFKPGPVFGNIVLADEINRATPKTQSALLEVMDRGKVTMDGEAHAVGSPFMVVATQNPVDYEGTFPLPESQMDRFLMRLQVGYPQPLDEMDILRAPKLGYDAIALNPVVSRSDILKMQALAGKKAFRGRIVCSIIFFRRRLSPPRGTEAEFKTGVSVRGGLFFARWTAQARALVEGRDFVIPEDVRGK